MLIFCYCHSRSVNSYAFFVQTIGFDYIDIGEHFVDTGNTYPCVLWYHDHRVVVVCDAVAGQLCRRDMYVVPCAGTPVRPLRLPERRLTSVPANSGTPYVLFLAKVMPNFFVKFSMTLLKIGHMVYCG